MNAHRNRKNYRSKTYRDRMWILSQKEEVYRRLAIQESERNRKLFRLMVTSVLSTDGDVMRVDYLVQLMGSYLGTGMYQELMT